MLNEDKRNRRCSWNKKINLIWIALWEWAIQLNYLLFLCCPKRRLKLKNEISTKRGKSEGSQQLNWKFNLLSGRAIGQQQTNSFLSHQQIKIILIWLIEEEKKNWIVCFAARAAFSFFKSSISINLLMKWRMKKRAAHHRKSTSLFSFFNERRKVSWLPSLGPPAAGVSFTNQIQLNFI